ncbi:MAG: BON domain-containing protein [Legionellaceae bacterium]|nr:BON domain-containing protein [Legionellaceae bacterium]
MKRKLHLYTLVFSSGLLLSGISTAAVEQHSPGTQTMHATKDSPQQLESKLGVALKEYSAKVNVRVKDGMVYLKGDLPSNTDYDRVVTMAESVKGVNEVNVDDLTVQGSKQPMGDTYITAKVKGSLIREGLFNTDIPSWSIGVETKDGKVFLSGEVKSNEEKQRVLDVVQSVQGVKSVDDQLKITNASSTDE